MILFLLAISLVFSSYQVTYKIEKDGTQNILQVQESQKEVSNAIILQDFSFHLAETTKTKEARLKEILYPKDALPKKVQYFLSQKRQVIIKDSELRTLIQQGPTQNRIDLTIVGDGYTLEEKEKFFSDAQRITDDLFKERTFASYLGLFNVYAVFVPSRDSGISDTTQRNTALGLYRMPVNSKRAIMVGNARAAEDAISLAPATDYPILIANDDYYGGLGGRYAITTRSETSGSMVLRHELGHNFGNVGEEYDGGQVYSGANHSSNASNPKWSHWQTSENIFETKFLSGDYVWQNLKDNRYQRNFTMPSGNYFFDARISSVGWSHDQEVKLSINNQAYPLTGLYTEDRSFFTIENAPQLPAGQHSIKIEDQSGDGDNVLAFAQLLAQPANIIRDRDHVAAYATFNASGRKAGYRPTYDTCLMRNMRSKNFCSVDQENMWIQFLKRIDIIDAVNVSRSKNGELNIRLESPDIPLEITWHNDSNDELIAKNVKEIKLDKNFNARIRLIVKLATPEVRIDSPYIYGKHMVHPNEH